MSTMHRCFSSSSATDTGSVKKEVSDDLSEVPLISLDEFYSKVEGFKLTDAEALEYMTFSAKMAMVSFKDEAEMMSFKNDF